MNEKLIKPSKVKKLLNLTEARSYKLKYLSSKIKLDQYLLLKQDTSNDEAVTAKLVTRPHSGEIVLWSRLHHENLNPLLEIITNGHNLYVFISPFVGRALRDCIMQISFIHHPKCFERKRMYAKDILKGLEYLHAKSFCLLTLRASNVQVCSKTDRAIISDFSLLSYSDDLPDFEVTSHGFMSPPELDYDDDDEINGLAVDIWCYGILCLQMFTSYYLPMSKAKIKLLNGLNFETLKKANNGSCLPDEIDVCLKEFLKPFLKLEPSLRMSAKEGLNSNFLCHAAKRLDALARDYWNDRDKMELEGEHSRKNTYFDCLTTNENCSNRTSAHLEKNVNRKAHQKYSTRAMTCQRNKTNSSVSNCKTANSSKSLPLLRFALINLPDKSESCPEFEKNCIRYKIKDGGPTNYNSIKNPSENEVKYSVVSSHHKTRFQKKFSPKNFSYRRYDSFNNNDSMENSISQRKFESNSTDPFRTGMKTFFDPNIIDDPCVENIECSKYLKNLDRNFEKSCNLRKTVSVKNAKQINVARCDFPLNHGFPHNVIASKGPKTHIEAGDVGAVVEEISDSFENEIHANSRSSYSHRNSHNHNDGHQHCHKFNTKPDSFVSQTVQNSRSTFYVNENTQPSSTEKRPPFKVIITDCCPDKKKTWLSKYKKSKKVLRPENGAPNFEGKNYSENNVCDTITLHDQSSDCPIEKPLLSATIEKPKGNWSRLFCPGKVKWNKKMKKKSN